MSSDGPNAICRQGDNLIAYRKVPIVFVPGIMGTRLHIPVDWWPDSYWDPDSKASMLSWALTFPGRMGELLHKNRKAKVMEEPGVDFADNDKGNIREDQVEKAKAMGWGGLAWRSYGTILHYLATARFGNHRCPPYAYGYDWRKDIWGRGAELAADILGASVGNAKPQRFGAKGILGREGADACIIVTHSMGGLVARSALAQSDQLRSKTLGVLHVVQPVTGAPVLYRRFHTGTRGEYLEGDFESAVFAKILGNEGEKFMTIVRGLTGALQLLPSNRYRDGVAGCGLNWLTYTVDEDRRSVVHKPTGSVHSIYRRSHRDRPPGIVRSDVGEDIQKEVRKRIDEVEKFHGRIGNYKLEGKTWAIYSTGLVTDSTVHFDLPPSGQDDEQNGFDPNPPPDQRGVAVRRDPDGHGDSTVPALSGSALFGPGAAVGIDTDPIDFATMRQLEVRGVSHEPCFSNQPVRNAVGAFILHLLTCKEEPEEAEEAPAPPAETPVAVEPKTHTVVKGEWAIKIAKDHGITFQRLKELNPEAPRSGDWDLIYPGEVFRVG